MIRLSRGKKLQSNTYGEDGQKKSHFQNSASRNSRKGSSSANVRYKQEDSQKQKNSSVSEPSLIDFDIFKKSVLWLGFSFLAVSCMALLAFAFYSLTSFFINHETFITKNVNIEGNSRFSEDEILYISGIELGTSAFDVNLNSAQSRLMQNPWIEEAKITRNLPNSFDIVINEREPRFFLLYENSIYYVDTEGNIISPVTQEDFKSFPLLELGASPEEALKILPDFIKYSQTHGLLPFSFDDLAWLKVSAGLGFEMFWEEKQILFSVSIHNWQENLEYLFHAIKDLEERKEFNKIAEIHAGNKQVWFIHK